jgi:hypothetical protein
VLTFKCTIIDPCKFKMSQASSIGIAMGFGLEDRDSIPDRGKRVSLPTASRPVMGTTQPLIQCVPGVISQEVKRLGREADHSLPSSAKVKNSGAIPPLPHTSSWLGA